MAGLEQLLQEIAAQPEVVARVLEAQEHAVLRVATAVEQRQPHAIVLVARGSSDNAAVYGRYLFEVCNQQLTSLGAPSAVTVYGRAPRLGHALVIGVSQSGQGEDVVEYLREARRQGALTVAIVNDVESPLAAGADHVLDCLAGPERSVPATKTVTAEMTLLAMLSVALSGVDLATLHVLPPAIEAAVGSRPAAADLARTLDGREVDAVIGRGFAFPPALEIALKLKETSYMPAEPYSAADFLHGPVALVESDFTAVVVDVGGRSSQAARQIAGGVRERGGAARLLSVGAGMTPADLPCEVDLSEPFAPIAAVVLGQLLALEIALARGLDPAQPRGLRKVTSTR